MKNKKLKRNFESFGDIDDEILYSVETDYIPVLTRLIFICFKENYSNESQRDIIDFIDEHPEAAEQYGNNFYKGDESLLAVFLKGVGAERFRKVERVVDCFIRNGASLNNCSIHLYGGVYPILAYLCWKPFLNNSEMEQIARALKVDFKTHEKLNNKDLFFVNSLLYVFKYFKEHHGNLKPKGYCMADLILQKLDWEVDYTDEFLESLYNLIKYLVKNNSYSDSSFEFFIDKINEKSQESEYSFMIFDLLDNVCEPPKDKWCLKKYNILKEYYSDLS